MDYRTQVLEDIKAIIAEPDYNKLWPEDQNWAARTQLCTYWITN